jgi:hypothetical protein
VVQRPWQGWLAAALATLATAALVIADVTDGGFRRWWLGHALTTDTVSGLLVLLITVLVVNEVVRRRQFRDRARAIAAQAAILVAQAARASRAVSAALDGSGDRENAADELRTYMMALLVSAPVLIDARVSRNFLEQAQLLAGEMAQALALMARDPAKAATSAARLSDAVQRLRAASGPLLQVLNPAELAAARAEDPASLGASGSASPDGGSPPPGAGDSPPDAGGSPSPDADNSPPPDRGA